MCKTAEHRVPDLKWLTLTSSGYIGSNLWVVYLFSTHHPLLLHLFSPGTHCHQVLLGWSHTDQKALASTQSYDKAGSSFYLILPDSWPQRKGLSCWSKGKEQTHISRFSVHIKQCKNHIGIIIIYNIWQQVFTQIFHLNNWGKFKRCIKVFSRNFMIGFRC